MTKDFIKDLGKYMPSQVVPGIITFISVPIYTRIFLPQDYGNYSLVMATVMVLSTLMGWLGMSVIRFYPAYDKDKKLNIFFGNIISLIFISILAIILISLILLFSIKSHISSKLYFLMYVGIGAFTVSAIFNVFQCFLRSKRRVNLYSGFAVWKSMASLGIALFLIYFLNKDIESLFWGVILSTVIILPLLCKKAVEGTSAFHFKIDSFLTKKIAKYSFPLVLGNLAAWILSLSDRYILGIFKGSQEVGIYSASYNISNHSVMLFVTLFYLASGPISMHIWEKKGESESKEFINKVTRYYLLFCIPLIIGLSILSRSIIDIMTGKQYFEGYKIIPFVTLGILFLGLQQRFQAGFLFYKKTSFITFAIVSSGLLNLFLNFLFVPRYGYFAAAITTLVSYVFLLFLMILLSRRFFVWQFPFKSLAKAACASAIMGISVYFVRIRLISSTLINLVFSVFLGGLIYFILLFLFREFQSAEKEAMKQILVKYLSSGLIPKKWKVQE